MECHGAATLTSREPRAREINELSSQLPWLSVRKYESGGPGPDSSTLEIDQLLHEVGIELKS